jgi:hypothetical protein
MPEVKIRKVVRAVEHAAHFVLSYSVQICEILTFRQTVSLPIIAANIHLFPFLKEKMLICNEKRPTAFAVSLCSFLLILWLVGLSHRGSRNLAAVVIRQPYNQ